MLAKTKRGFGFVSTVEKFRNGRRKRTEILDVATSKVKTAFCEQNFLFSNNNYKQHEKSILFLFIYNGSFCRN